MPFILTLFVLAPHAELEISEEFYAAIKDASANLAELTSVEEKFDALMDNKMLQRERTMAPAGCSTQINNNPTA